MLFTKHYTSHHKGENVSIDTSFISIVVPAYNAEDTIVKCIESLLSQTYPKDKHEIIVVDNNSKDKTYKIIQSFPDVIALQQRDKQNSGATRNFGIRHARGKIIANIDSDCIADENWLINGIRCFEDHTVGGVCGLIKSQKPVTWIEKHQDRQKVHDYSNADTEQRTVSLLITGNAFIRKSIFDRVGLFEDSLSGGDDFDISQKILTQTKYKLIFDPKAIVYHRHCTTLASYMEQSYRYGYSGLFVHYKYRPEYVEKLSKDGILKVIYWKLRFSVLHNLGIILKNLIFLCFTWKAQYRHNAIDAFLTMLRQIAYAYGSYRCSKDYNIPFCDLR